jgi:heme exporter protein A
VLRAAGLAGRRGRRLLFADLDLELAPGALVWLRGPNGVGKTSLMRLLAGLAQPEAGTVTWRGAPIRTARADWQRDLIYIGHLNALKDDLTLAEALEFLAALGGATPTAAQVQRALEAVGIGQRRHAAVRTLSQGQRRRGALARLALDDAPRVWILDEPHDALDTEGRSALDALLVAHAQRGGRVLLTSHHELRLPGMAVLDLGAFATPAAAS